MPFQEFTNADDVSSRWPYDFQYIDPDAGSGSLDSESTLDISGVVDVEDSLDTSGTYDVSGTKDVESSEITHYEYLGVFAAEMRYIDEQINELYDQRFIQSASGRELEKLGAPLGITKREGESEASFRYRVRLGKAIAASSGTAQDIEAIIRIAFGEDAMANIDVTNVDSEPVTQFAVPQPYIDETPLTRVELQDELARSFPCGHDVQVITSDTFILGEDGPQGLGNGALI